MDFRKFNIKREIHHEEVFNFSEMVTYLLWAFIAGVLILLVVAVQKPGPTWTAFLGCVPTLALLAYAHGTVIYRALTDKRPVILFDRDANGKLNVSEVPEKVGPCILVFNFNQADQLIVNLKEADLQKHLSKS